MSTNALTDTALRFSHADTGTKLAHFSLYYHAEFVGYLSGHAFTDAHRPWTAKLDVDDTPHEFPTLTDAMNWLIQVEEEDLRTP